MSLSSFVNIFTWTCLDSLCHNPQQQQHYEPCKPCCHMCMACTPAAAFDFLMVTATTAVCYSSRHIWKVFPHVCVSALFHMLELWLTQGRLAQGGVVFYKLTLSAVKQRAPELVKHSGSNFSWSSFCNVALRNVNCCAKSRTPITKMHGYKWIMHCTKLDRGNFIMHSLSQYCPHSGYLLQLCMITSMSAYISIKKDLHEAYSQTCIFLASVRRGHMNMLSFRYGQFLQARWGFLTHGGMVKVIWWQSSITASCWNNCQAILSVSTLL